MKKMGHIAYVLLGGNLLDVKQTFKLAIQEIEGKAGGVTSQSSLYKSAAWGFESDDDFLNQVIEIHTPLIARELLSVLLKIEQHLGRVRNPTSSGFSSRIIDIDILYYNNEVIESSHLVIPHYAVQERMFTLMPLNDLIPDYIHPVLNQTNAQLLGRCRDKNIPEKL